MSLNPDETNNHTKPEQNTVAGSPAKGEVVLCIAVNGKRPVSHLIAKLSDIEGMISVSALEGRDLD